MKARSTSGRYILTTGSLVYTGQGLSIPLTEDVAYPFASPEEAERMRQHLLKHTPRAWMTSWARLRVMEVLHAST